MTPLLLLDVGGVLNALPDSSAWQRSQRGRAEADGMTWQLTSWHEQGLVELQWLTVRVMTPPRAAGAARPAAF